MAKNYKGQAIADNHVYASQVGFNN